MPNYPLFKNNYILRNAYTSIFLVPSLLFHSHLFVICTFVSTHAYRTYWVHLAWLNMSRLDNLGSANPPITCHQGVAPCGIAFGNVGLLSFCWSYSCNYVVENSCVQLPYRAYYSQMSWYSLISGSSFVILPEL